MNAEGQSPTAAASANARVVIFLFMADSVLVRSRRALTLKNRMLLFGAEYCVAAHVAQWSYCL